MDLVRRTRSLIVPINVKMKVRYFSRSVSSSGLNPLVSGGNPLIFMLRTTSAGLSRRTERPTDLYDGFQLIYQLSLLCYEFCVK
jgi:hypothetical protein